MEIPVLTHINNSRVDVVSRLQLLVRFAEQLLAKQIIVVVARLPRAAIGAVKMHVRYKLQL